MNFVRIGNLLLLGSSHILSALFGKSIVMGKAFAVSFETVAGCNLQCPGCERGAGLIQRKTGMMDIEEYFIALNKLPSTVFHLNLHFQGEPLLHPKIVNFVRLARQKKMFVSFSTNAHLLDDIVAEELISAGLSHMIISLDGYDKDSYEYYRKGGDFELVINNVQQLKKIKQKKRTKYPFIEIQTVVTSSNEHHLDQIKKLSKNIGADKYSIKTAYVPDLTTAPEYLPDSVRYSRYVTNPDGTLRLKKNVPRLCYRMKSSCVVLNDFNVVPCCFDKNGTFILGNLLEQDFSKIHNGETAKNLRSNLATGKRPDICLNCIR